MAEKLSSHSRIFLVRLARLRGGLHLRDLRCRKRVSCVVCGFHQFRNAAYDELESMTWCQDNEFLDDERRFIFHIFSSHRVLENDLNHRWTQILRIWISISVLQVQNPTPSICAYPGFILNGEYVLFAALFGVVAWRASEFCFLNWGHRFRGHRLRPPHLSRGARL